GADDEREVVGGDAGAAHHGEREGHRAENREHLRPQRNVREDVVGAGGEALGLAAEEEEDGGDSDGGTGRIPPERGEGSRREAPAPLNPLWPGHRWPFHTSTMIHQTTMF